jgi:hypothetical protein
LFLCYRVIIIIIIIHIVNFVSTWLSKCVLVERCPSKRHKIVWGSGGVAPSFVASSLDGNKRSLHASAALSPDALYGRPCGQQNPSGRFLVENTACLRYKQLLLLPQRLPCREHGPFSYKDQALREIANVRRSSCKLSDFCPMLIKIGICRERFGNPPGWSHSVPCGRTDVTKLTVATRFSVAPKG